MAADRYWRILVTQVVDPSWNMVGLFEVELLSAQGDDVTDNLGEHASAAHGDDGMSAAYAINNDPHWPTYTPGWWVDDPDHPHFGFEPPIVPWWWQVDLLVSREIKSLAIEMESAAYGMAPRDFSLQRSSDGQDWITVLEVHGESRWGAAPPGEIDRLEYDLPPVFQSTVSPVLPVRVRIGRVEQSAVPVLIRIADQGVFSGATPVSIGVPDQSASAGYGAARAGAWRVVVVLAGQDVSSRVMGSVEVDAEEGSARVASLSLRPDQSLGGPLGWVGWSISIDFAALDGDGGARHSLRVFTGVVDVPSVDLSTGIVSLVCTDDLQGVFQAMSDAQIDALVGGWWSGAVFNPAASRGWQRVQDLSSTLRSSVDLDEYRVPRVTGWQFNGPDIVFGDDLVEDGSLVIAFAPRSEIINQVLVEFSYQYERRCSQGFQVGYGLGSLREVLDTGSYLIPRETVLGAISALGAVPVNLTYLDIPPGGAQTSAGGGVTIFVPPSQPDKYCMGFAALLRFDWSQRVSETHALRVSLPSSIAQNGIRSASLSATLQAKAESGEVWEGRSWAVGSGRNAAFQPGYTPGAVPAGGAVWVQAPADPGFDLGAANLANRTLLAMAESMIAASHRRTSVSFVTPLNPSVNPARCVRVIAQGVTAEGKVRRVRHECDADTGRAVSRIELAVSGDGAVGVAVPQPVSDVQMVGLSAGGSAQVPGDTSVTWDNKKLRIEVPGVPSQYRDNVDIRINGNVEVVISRDFFQMVLP